MENIGLAAVLNTANFDKGLGVYTSGLAKMNKLTDLTASTISGAFKVATGALLIGVGAIGGILATSVKAAADAEQIAAQTDAVLQSTKGVAGVTREAVGDLATALSELTPFEDDAIQGGENLLLTFTNIGKNVFPLATETMLDMSQAMGQDLKSSAIQLGKALNQPAEGLSALQRVGVQFTKAQEGQVKALVAAGKTEEAQRVILKELQTEFGGAAKAAGKTFAGQLQILKNTLGNVQEEIGGALLPVLTKLAGAFVKVLADPKVKAGIKVITNGIEDLVDILGDLTSGREYNALSRFDALLEKVFGRQTAQSIRNILSSLGGFKDFILNNLIPAVQRLWGAFQVGGLEGLGGQIARELQQAWPAISAQLSTWSGQFWNWLTGPSGAIAQAAGKISEFAVKLGTALQQNWPTISKQFATWGTQFWNWLTGPQGAIQQAGDKLGQLAGTLARVLTEKWDTLIAPSLAGWAALFWDWITNSGSGVLVSISENMGKLATNIENWSKDENTKERFREIGRTLAQAIIDGLGNLFEDKGKGNNLIIILFTNLWNAGLSNLRSFMNLGRALSEGIMAGVFSIFTDQQTAMNLAQAITTMEQNAVNGVIAQLGNILQPLFTAIQTLISTFWASHPPTAPAAPAPYSPLPSNVSQFANGGWVNRTGLALVHRGEYVIPARQTSNISNNNSRSVGTVTVNINGSTGMGVSEIKKAVYAGIREVLEAA